MPKKRSQATNIELIQADVNFLAQRVSSIESKINWFLAVMVAGVMAALFKVIFK